MSNDRDKIIIAYDGGCPFCSSYVRMQRLQNLGVDLELVNFREAPDLVDKLKQKGLDPNDGMLVKIAGEEYYADEAMTVLSTLSTSKNFLNLGFKWVFKNKTRAKWLYPVLRVGRNLALTVLRKPQL